MYVYKTTYSSKTTSLSENIILEIPGGWFNLNQTKCNWIYYETNYKDSLFRSILNSNGEIRRNRIPSLVQVTTGMIENSHLLWIHPPRKSQFRILELAPLPRLERDKSGIKKQWTDSLKLTKGWGEWNDLTVNSRYTYLGKDSVALPILGLIESEIVKAVSTSKLGNNDVLFYFNKNYGLIKAEYSIFDGTKIDIVLVNRIRRL